MKNQNKSIIVLGFMLCGLIACNSDTTTEQPAVIESPAPTSVVADTSDFPPLSSIKESAPAVTATIPPPTTLNPSVPLSPSNGPFATASNTPIPVATKAPVKTQASSARLNPAHGQPGHNCAIAVGAPLDKAAAPAPKPATPTVVSTPQVETQVLPSPAVTAAAPNADPNAKLNPAHGQAGHNCAVAVGAPLPKYK
jgi:hypothetical protein